MGRVQDQMYLGLEIYQNSKEVPMSEKVFLDEGEVKVTQARFIVPAQTYAMAGITSVASLKQDPSRKRPNRVMIIGFIATLWGFSVSVSAGVIGLLVLAAGMAWWLLQKPTYYVVLHSASGESRALKSKNGEWIARVVTALNDAIVARG